MAIYQYASRRFLAFALFSVIVHVTLDSATAQLFERSLALTHARIVTEDGSIHEDGSILITGEKISKIGADVDIPLLSTRIDLKGATVTAGLIDCWSGWAESEGGSADPTRHAADAFDRYATRHLQDVLASGVTALYVSPAGAPGADGYGAVIRLAPGPAADVAYGKVLSNESALVIDLGSNGKPIVRLKTLQAVQKLFDDAREFRRKSQEYTDKLKEYEEKLQEAADKKKEADKAKPKATAAADEKKPEAERAEKKPEEKEPTKPTRPPRNPKLEVILRAIDREVPVRVVANRSDEILNALELAERFSLDLVLEGATEAHLVADQIAESQATVILGTQYLPERRSNDFHRRSDPQIGNRLSQAGVTWAIGSGDADPAGSRFLLQNAQLASTTGRLDRQSKASYRSVSNGPLPLVADFVEKSTILDISSTGDESLDLLTAQAADVLRVADQIGRLRPGLLADLVVWSGDPLAPDTKVLRVYVGGELVYLAPALEPKGDAS